jgi:hypothetical protein
MDALGKATGYSTLEDARLYVDMAKTGEARAAFTEKDVCDNE